MSRATKLQEIVANRDGLNLKVIDDSNVRLNLIYNTLKHRGIENRANFINPVDFRRTNIKNIHNIDQMLRVEQAVQAGKNIGVLVDVDCDGMTSGAMFINYFKDNYDNARLVPIFPKAKLHGVKSNFDNIVEYCEGYDLDYVILPDSSSNDVSAIEDLIAKGVKVLVIDHHDLSDNVIEKNPTWLINNQSPFNEDGVNRNFTGVGMVYECLKYLDKRNGFDLADGYLDLFAIGQIADVSDISNLEIRSLMLRGFQAMNNPLVKQFVEQNRTQLSPKAFQFSLIPMINSVTRVGSVDEKNVLFKALIKDDSSDYQISKRRNVNHHFVYEDIDVDVYTYVINVMEKIKARQKKMVDKALKDATYLSEENDNFNLVRIDNQGAGITGLIGNKLLGDTGKASFIVYGDGTEQKGSMRIPMAYHDTLEQLRSRFADLGNLNYAQGHENAAGVSFNLSDDLVKPTIEILNEMFVPVKETHIVDDYYINETPTLDTIRTVYDMSYCFGGKVSEPVIGVLGLHVTPDQFKINKQTMHIKVNGIDFIKFNLSDDELENINERLNESYNLYVDVVGTVGMNHFLGKTTPQFIINEMEFSTKIVTEINDSLVF